MVLILRKEIWIVNVAETVELSWCCSGRWMLYGRLEKVEVQVKYLTVLSRSEILK